MNWTWSIIAGSFDDYTDADGGFDEYHDPSSEAEAGTKPISLTAAWMTERATWTSTNRANFHPRDGSSAGQLLSRPFSGVVAGSISAITTRRPQTLGLKYRPGRTVLHQKYGQGEIIAASGHI
ncbi:MAG: hypothetical protein R3C56_03785 [Pirellulaceae bacterium]